MKTLLIALCIFVALAYLCGIACTDALTLTINGQLVEGPLEALAGVLGLCVAVVVLVCVAILLGFVFAGVGLLVLGVLAFVGLIVLAVMFPFLLPLLIPLFILWAYCAGVRRGRRRLRA